MDLTPLMKGQIPYSNFLINTLQKTKVQNELKVQFGSTFPSELEREGIQKLVAVLRDEGEKRTGHT